MTRLFLLALAAGLAACGNTASTSSQNATITTVAQVEIALTLAEKLATNYVALPPCPGPTLCADAAAVARIRAADNQAYIAVKSARAAGPNADTVAATAAINALVAAIPAASPTQVWK